MPPLLRKRTPALRRAWVPTRRPAWCQCPTSIKPALRTATAVRCRPATFATVSCAPMQRSMSARTTRSFRPMIRHWGLTRSAAEPAFVLRIRRAVVAGSALHQQRANRRTQPHRPMSMRRQAVSGSRSYAWRTRGPWTQGPRSQARADGATARRCARRSMAAGSVAFCKTNLFPCASHRDFSGHTRTSSRSQANAEVSMPMRPELPPSPSGCRWNGRGRR